MVLQAKNQTIRPLLLPVLRSSLYNLDLGNKSHSALHHNIGGKIMFLSKVSFVLAII